MRKAFLSLFTIALIISPLIALESQGQDFVILPFGERGQIKMTYDARQRPNAVFLNGKVHLAINADAPIGANGTSKTNPIAVTYDLKLLDFSDFVHPGT